MRAIAASFARAARGYASLGGARLAARALPLAAARPAVTRRVLAADGGAVRALNLHEYQSKDLMEKFGVVVQNGRMAASPAEARAVAEAIRASNPRAELVLKAQIHAGGRGKGVFDTGFKGGVKICSAPAEVEELAGKMLGHKLITKQTGAGGQLVTKVLVNEGITIKRELYFAILMDRKYGGPVIVASTQGGMDIEEVAEKDPGAIITEPVDITKGLGDAQAEGLAKRLGFPDALLPAAVKQFRSLYALFAGTDATQVEINPLAVGSYPGREGSDTVFAVDAKLNFDDNAAFRQAPIYAQRDKTMEDPRDVAAEEAGLNYVGLDGSIGCMVNGAGLAMATMDIIKLHGGAPANFLDVGGGATAEQVTTAFKILTSDPNVKAILVNIFGGIMRCDTIATGIVKAAKDVGLRVPLVVRLEGTNVAKGKEILATSGIACVTADNLDDAAIKAVATLKA